MKYIIFLFYNTNISDNDAKSRKVPRTLAAFFHIEWQGKSSRKGISLILNPLIPVSDDVNEIDGFFVPTA
jgi:hypothetical protein